jgi:hypothetical protein
MLGTAYPSYPASITSDSNVFESPREAAAAAVVVAAMGEAD